MKTADIFIYIAGLLWTIEGIPQVVKLFKTKSVEGISSLFFILCGTAFIFYFIGNIMLNQMSVVIANILPFINICIIVFLIFRYRKRGKK